MQLRQRQAIEIEFWRTSEKESPEADFAEVLVWKMAEAGILLDCIRRYERDFRRAGTVLELGGGQGWGACLVKRLHPNAQVIASDISEWAVASLPKWEHVFSTKVDDFFACTGDDIPLLDDSVDLVFVFAAAHHFGCHRKTLAEIRRVLRPGGRCLYLNEPVCPPPFYKAAVWRVNRKRPEVPEDVLVTSKLLQIGRELGLEAEAHAYPHTMARGAVETVYFGAQRAFPPLARVLPSTANFVFTKPGRAASS